MELLLPLYSVLAVLASSGFFMLKLLGVREENFFTVMWVGLFPVTTMAYVVNFFFPLQSAYSFLCLLPACFGAPGLFSRAKKWCAHGVKNCFFQGSFFVFIAFLTLALFVLSPLGQAYDTDLYHLQIISWAREYALVPGLGNLHSRLANGSAWYLLGGMLPLDLALLPTFMSVLFMVLAQGWVFSHLMHVQNLWERIYFLCLIPLCFLYQTRWKIYANLYVDSISLFVFLFVLYNFLRMWLCQQRGSYSLHAQNFLFLALGFAIKPLVIVPLLLVLIFECFLLVQKELTGAFFIKVLLAPAFLGVLWCARNVILTGYPVFPLTLLAFPVDWILDKSIVEGNRIAVMGWARWPRSGYQVALETGISYWFPSWIHAFLSSKKEWATFILPLLAALSIWLWALCSKFVLVSKFIFTLCFLPILYWFYMYPDSRFGLEFVWGAWASGVVVLSLHSRASSALEKVFALLSTYYKKVVCVVCAVFCILSSVQLMQAEPSLAWITPSWPTRPVEQIRILADVEGESFTLWTPSQGDDRCGLAPLPCGFANSQLRMRNPHDLGEGFYLAR